MELLDARTKFPQVYQHGHSWCIPAGFEVLLHYFDLPKPTQEDMVLLYDKVFGAKGYGEPIQVNGQLRYRTVKLTNPTVEQLKNYGFPLGDFNTFKDITNSLLPQNCGRVFDRSSDCHEKFEYYLDQALKNQDGILAAVKLPDGNCHILPVVGFDGKCVMVYDPGARTIEVKALGDLNRDCVVFKKNA